MDGHELVKEGLKRRFKDPFLSTYSIVFLLFNYEIPILIFSGLPALKKITEIKTHIAHNYFMAIWLPVGLTAIIILALPKLLFRAYKHAEENRIQIENLALEANESLRPHQLSLSKTKEQLDSEIDKNSKLTELASSKDQKIGELQSEIKQLRENINSNKKSIMASEAEINDLKIQLETKKRSGNIETSKNSSAQTVGAVDLLNDIGINLEMAAEIRKYINDTKKPSSLAKNEYIEGAKKIAQHIKNSIPENTKVESGYRNFTAYLRNGDYVNAAAGLGQMASSLVLNKDELAALEFAKSLIDKVSRYSYG